MKQKKVTKAELEKFIKEKLFEIRMSGRGMDGWNNYIGHDWSGWLCGPCQTRDSHALDRSNYRVALEMLGGEQDGKVESRSVNHWGVGWIDQIMVKATAKTAVKKLYEISKSLEDYPVLDDSDFSQEENDELEEKNYSSEFQRELFKFVGFKNFEVRLRDKRQGAVDIILSQALYDASGYSGLENAWIDEKTLKRYFEGDGKWEISRLADEGDLLCRALINTGMVKRPNKTA